MAKGTGAILGIVLIAVSSGCAQKDTWLTKPGSAVLSSREDSRISADLRAQYWDDAATLALRNIHQDEGPQNSEVEIPEDLIQSYYTPLILVYNADRLVASNEVVDEFHIHAWETPLLRELSVGVYDTTSWISTWAPGTASSGNSVLDSLMTKHDLSLLSKRLVGDIQTLRLVSTRPLNIRALAMYVGAIPGVKWAEVGGLGTLGNLPEDISAEVLSGQMLLEYKSIGLPGGPQMKWYFATTSEDLVTFLGATK